MLWLAISLKIFLALFLAGFLRRVLLHRPPASAAVRRSSGTAAGGGAFKPAAQPVVVSPEDVFPPFAGYSHAALVPAGARLVFVSGQLGITGKVTPHQMQRHKLRSA